MHVINSIKIEQIAEIPLTLRVKPYIIGGVREIQNDIKKEDYYHRDRNQPSNLQNQNHHQQMKHH